MKKKYVLPDKETPRVKEDLQQPQLGWVPLSLGEKLSRGTFEKGSPKENLYHNLKRA